MKKINIWCLGDAVVDLLPLNDNEYRACAGGAPANVAIGIAKLGFKSGFIGRVGRDPFGQLMYDIFEQYHVDCKHIEFDEKIKTSTVLVDLGVTGERSFTFLVSPSADQFLSKAALPSFNDDILHFCSLALVGEICRATLKTAVNNFKKTYGKISFDINLREQMWHDKNEMRTIIDTFAKEADILKLSDDELFWLTKNTDWNDSLNILKNDYPAQLKIVTKGAEGSVIIWNEKYYNYSTYKVECVDTTGAGDAFVAGLLSSVAEYGMPKSLNIVDKMISNASACGAMATTNKGALTALPDNKCLMDFLANNHLLKAKEIIV